MLLKIALDLIGTFCKVDQDIALVLVLAKLLADSRLADTSCTLDKKGFLPFSSFSASVVYYTFYALVS